MFKMRRGVIFFTIVLLVVMMVLPSVGAQENQLVEEVQTELEYKLVGEEEGHYAYQKNHKNDPINPEVSVSKNGNPMVPESSYEHSDYLNEDAKVFKAADNVYSFSGFGLANTVMIEGEDGIIIIDPNSDMHVGDMVYTAVRDITDKPVKGIIYSHNHIDHVGGARSFVTREQVENGEVAIVAHHKLMGNIKNIFSVITPIMVQRGSYHTGEYLDWNYKSGKDSGYVHGGIGVPFQGRHEEEKQEEISFFKPTIMVPDEGSTMTIAGVEMEIMYAPSETEDELVFYLPKEKVLITSEVINPTFPNLYSPRGTKTRDVGQWIESIDEMRYRFDEAKYMVPTHGRPVYGKRNVNKRMTDYRDAISWVYQQSIRGINQGFNKDQLVEFVNLPERLNDPWDHGLGNHYGDYNLSVKAIYTDFLGWFEGDPTELSRAPYETRASNYVEVMGGLEKVKKETREAIDRKEYEWAAELITWAVRAFPEDTESKLLKAEALEELGYLSTAANVRGFYLSAAQELRGELESNVIDPGRGDILKELDFSSLVSMITYNWDAEKAEKDDVNLGVKFVLKNGKEKEKAAILVRGGAVEFVSAEHADSLGLFDINSIVTVTKESLESILLEESTIEEEIAERGMEVYNVIGFKKFISYLDGKIAYRDIKLADR
ncbi:alkyl sulfatase dimerization domain-containing protein [Chengkuizengella marina]|uniref:MBL fold metallo-hydrolase n=1 Tax=Chengkuizengella marina TaxID=2507566 RepID=A0A6N9Q6G3_9BACL|nr:alkyl sulfatase dimerization domain-containing protein [Chengkuizengella marina]NBI30204.1 MBL fold metallo-hydrolase [Chengkuizengella marina]